MTRTKRSPLPAKESLVEVPSDTQISSPQVEHPQNSSFGENNEDEVDETEYVDEHESDHDDSDEDDQSESDESSESVHSDVELNDRSHKKCIFDDEEDESVQNSPVYGEYQTETFDDEEEVELHVDSTKSTSTTSQGQESNDSTSATAHLWDVVNWEPKMLPNDQLPKKVKDGEGEQSSTISYPNCHFTKREIENAIRSGLENHKGDFDYFLIYQRKPEFEWVRRKLTRDTNKIILIRRAYHAHQELLAAYRGKDIKKYPLRQHRNPEYYEAKYDIWDQVWARVYPDRGEPYDDDDDLYTEFRFDGLRGKIHELRLRPVEVRMKKAEYLDPQGLTITGCYPPWTRKEIKKSKEQVAFAYS